MKGFRSMYRHSPIKSCLEFWFWFDRQSQNIPSIHLVASLSFNSHVFCTTSFRSERARRQRCSGTRCLSSSRSISTRSPPWSTAILCICTSSRLRSTNRSSSSRRVLLPSASKPILRPTSCTRPISVLQLLRAICATAWAVPSSFRPARRAGCSRN
ncbi:hypothetical protein CPB84DRAFT_1173417, partial [Gymnopilus junonius]